MSGGKFHVHGPHDHAVEHEAAHGADHGSGDHGGAKGGFSLPQTVAIFTAILATIGAIVSYQGGHTQNEALLHKNEAVLKKTEAANQWSYYQAKGTKKNLAELAEALATDPEKKAKYAAEAARYKGEQEAIKKDAEGYEKLSIDADNASKHALSPHNKLAQAMTLIQIAISLASICVLTRRRWMLGLAGVAAAGGLVYWVLAFTLTGV
ncbi:MAG: DUF4337 domain-containing protein, partial [Betaproteobacteria bacterium]